MSISQSFKSGKIDPGSRSGSVPKCNRLFIVSMHIPLKILWKSVNSLQSNVSQCQKWPISPCWKMEKLYPKIVSRPGSTIRATKIHENRSATVWVILLTDKPTKWKHYLLPSVEVNIRIDLHMTYMQALTNGRYRCAYCSDHSYTCVSSRCVSLQRVL